MQKKAFGAPIGNVNALKTGGRLQLQTRKLDGRCQLAKWLRSLRQSIINDLGGAANVTAAQVILIDRISFKAANASYFEQALSRGESRDFNSYITIVNSLRSDLQLLGLGRQARDAVLSFLDEQAIRKRVRPEKIVAPGGL